MPMHNAKCQSTMQITSQPLIKWLAIHLPYNSLEIC